MSNLKWSAMGEGTYAGSSGNLVIGLVEQTDAGRWTWSIDAVKVGLLFHGQGEARSAPAGKRALSQAWAKWLDFAALAPANQNR